MLRPVLYSIQEAFMVSFFFIEFTRRSTVSFTFTLLNSKSLTIYSHRSTTSRDLTTLINQEFGQMSAFLIKGRKRKTNRLRLRVSMRSYRYRGWVDWRLFCIRVRRCWSIKRSGFRLTIPGWRSLEATIVQSVDVCLGSCSVWLLRSRRELAGQKKEKRMRRRRQEIEKCRSL